MVTNQKKAQSSTLLVNVGFGVVFAILAVTMLGFGNLSRLQNLGASLGSGQASALNSLGMGAGAGLVAAPCTGPIMGALIAYSTHLSSAWQSILLFFLYSLGFAIPYVFLGLAANRVKSFKVSARIQVAIKMIFASAMFGLAAYYLKNTAYESLHGLKGNWQNIAIACLVLGSIGIAFILSRASLMHHKVTQLLPTILFGLGLFASVQWATGTDITAEVKWIKNEAAGYAAAKEQNKPIVLDGWADWCVACKEMDKTTFLDPAVISLLKDEWVTVKLDLTESNDANEALAQKYEMPGLPTLVMIPADGDLSKAKRLTGYVTRERLIQELKSFQGK
jgi:thiol:disulfide interchange protein DsbD